jgi:tetratricopeptide (TPR) repeat protein
MKVIECAQQAVQIDPNFVSAYVELSKAHSLLYYFWYDHSEERLNEAKHAADKALEIAPSSPQIRIALVHYYLYCHRDTERALQEIEIAEQGLPDDEDVLTTKASIYQIQGRWDEALEVYKKAFALSPRDASLPTELSGIYWVTRRYKEAMDWCEEAMVLAPEDAWPYLYKVFINWFWKGDTVSARAALEKMPKGHAWEPWVWFWQEMFEGHYQAGIKQLNITTDEWIRIKIRALPKVLLAGLAYEYDGNLKEAQNNYDRARVMLKSEVLKHPDDPRYHSSLGIVYAGLGQKEKAIAEGKKAVDLLPLSRDAFYGIPYLEDLAHIYALAGESKAALEQLDHLLGIPSWISVSWIKIDPRWRKLRGHRLYKKIMDKHRKDH